ncbi:MAG: 7-cyano-7-deazaguanine synthase QueC [Parvularculaceae bacterium]
MNPKHALVLFSGGQDSAIILAWALARYERVETVGFDYGQRHAVELDARTALRREYSAAFPVWADRLGDDHLVDLGGLGTISETALTRDAAIRIEENGLPSTFVPGRNLVFLVMAGALAYRRHIGELVGGMCETDYSGYPDCRAATLNVQMDAINLGMETGLALRTPLMHSSKAQSWQIAKELGGDRLVEIINEHSHTCYLGARSTRHDWGYGCGECPACELRARGWNAYVAATSCSLATA